MFEKEVLPSLDGELIARMKDEMLGLYTDEGFVPDEVLDRLKELVIH